MAGYRRSYWKTVIVAALVAFGGAASLAVLLAAEWLRPREPAGWLVWGGAVIVAGGTLLWATLVVTGGIIGLRRDALEARGVPYARREPREWVPGPVIAAVFGVARQSLQALRGSAGTLSLRPGEMVEVKSLPEILATLDDRGTLDGLPFMPEMSASCGKRVRVFRRVDKLNDWVGHSGLRRVRETVLLERLRCDGAHHGGCQANCHLRWKEAWLRRPTSGAAVYSDPGAAAAPSPRQPPSSGSDLDRLASRADESGGVRYVCQVTELAAGTTSLEWRDPRHYLRDLARGNIRLGPWLVGVSIAVFNWAQRTRGGAGSPNYAVSEQADSPHEVLNLQPGDVVRVRSKREIERTLNSRSRNRGLWFDKELLRFCGGEYRVRSRVDHLIKERTGELIHLTNPCIILDGVTASGEYLGFCAQNEAIFWREIWLERIGSPGNAAAS